MTQVFDYEDVVRDNGAALLLALTRSNRAYNLLYALGEATPETVETFKPGEAEELIQIAHEVSMGMRTTERHREIAEKVSPAILRYVAIGG